MLHQVGHALGVNLHQFQVDIGPFQQVLGQHAHARSDFQYRHRHGGGIGLQGVHDGPGDALVGQEMLAQGLFCSNFHTYIFL